MAPRLELGDPQPVSRRPTPPPVQPPLPHDEAPGPDTAVAEALVPMAGAGIGASMTLRPNVNAVTGHHH